MREVAESHCCAALLCSDVSIGQQRGHLSICRRSLLRELFFQDRHVRACVRVCVAGVVVGWLAGWLAGRVAWTFASDRSGMASLATST
jgi:hypothetical protein